MADMTSWESLNEKDLPKMTVKDTLKRYRHRLEIAKKYRDREGYDDLWYRLVDMYRGKQFDKDDLSKGDMISVNLTFSTINVIGPSIAINYPKIVVYPRRPEFDLQAAIVESVVNHWWKHEDIKQEFQMAVKDSLLVGHGWVKVGYRHVEKLEARPEEEMADELQQKEQELNAFATENPDLAPDLPGTEDVAAAIPPAQSVVVEDRPFVERVSPFDMYVDPEGTTMGDIKWIAQKIERPLEEVRRDKRYAAGARRALKEDSTTNKEWLDQGRGAHKKYGEDIKRVCIWEFYDLQRGTLCVFAENGDKFLVEPMDMPYEYGQPFYMIRNYEVPDRFYPIGDVEQIESVQKELNWTRSQMMMARHKDLRKYLGRKTAFPQEAIDALMSDKDNEIAWVEDDNFPLDQVLVPVQGNAAQSELYKHSDVIENDLEKISGVSDYMRGALPETTRTATEASIIQDAINSRAADKLAKVEDAVREIAARLVQLAQQYTTQEQVAQFVGQDGASYWVEWDPLVIQGEFIFEVEAGSTQPKNETFRRQQAVQMLNSLAPFLGTGHINIGEFLSYIMQFGFDVKDPKKFVKSDEQVQMEQMQMMQAQAMMGGGEPPPEQGGGKPPPGGGGGAKGKAPEQDKNRSRGQRPKDDLRSQLRGQVGLDPRIGGGALGPGGG